MTQTGTREIVAIFSFLRRTMNPLQPWEQKYIVIRDAAEVEPKRAELIAEGVKRLTVLGQR